MHGQDKRPPAMQDPKFHRCERLASATTAILMNHTHGTDVCRRKEFMPYKASPNCSHDNVHTTMHAIVAYHTQAKEIMYHKANLNRIQSEYTGQPLSRIEADTNRDNYMNPIEAREYGIIDHVIGSDENVFQVGTCTRIGATVGVISCGVHESHVRMWSSMDICRVVLGRINTSAYQYRT